MDPTLLSTRKANMHKRRMRIVDEARQMLVNGGYDGLNLRALAAAAGVTVPTLYNLIGNKEQIVVALFADALNEIEQRMATHRGTEPLEMAEAVVIESTGLFAEDEDYYRAAFIAVEHLSQSDEHYDAVARLYAWGERLAAESYVACKRAGFLRGKISPDLVGGHILRSYRTSCRAWAFRRLSLAEFRQQALIDVYLALAADAVDTFHRRLIQKFSHLETDTVASPSQKSGIRTTRRKKQ
jgi:AcrR family transcriptional regulator